MSLEENKTMEVKQPDRETGVFSAIEDIYKKINALKNTISFLQEKIDPILVPPRPFNFEERKNDKESSSLTITIQKIIDVLDEVDISIRLLIDRVDL